MPDFRWTLLVAGLFAGCSQLGGGTELPSPIQVYIYAASDSAKPVAARQTRIWVMDSLSADSVHLTSRGLLTDSAGVLQLPPDSGTFLLESWILRPPPESLSMHATILASAYPDTSCLQVLGRSNALQRLHSCRDTQSNPSRGWGSSHPEVVAVVRVSGGASHPFRMIRGGDTTLPLSEVRLWSVGDSLVFRGVMRSGGSTGQLPTLMAKAKFVIQVWSKAGAAPEHISAKRRWSLADSTWQACVLNLAAFGSTITTLHSCTLGPGPMPEDSANYWSLVDFVP